MDFLEDLKMSLLNLSFVMIYIIRKMLLLVKLYHLNYIKDNIFECFSKKYIKLLFFKKLIFSKIYNDEKSKT